MNQTEAERLAARAGYWTGMAVRMAIIALFVWWGYQIHTDVRAMRERKCGSDATDEVRP
jgi:hypothetical protein